MTYEKVRHIEGEMCNVIMTNNGSKDVNILIKAHSVDDLIIEY